MATATKKTGTALAKTGAAPYHKLTVRQGESVIKMGTFGPDILRQVLVRWSTICGGLPPGHTANFSIRGVLNKPK